MRRDLGPALMGEIARDLKASIEYALAHRADVVLAARTASRLDEVAKEVTALGRRGVAIPRRYGTARSVTASLTASAFFR